MCDSLTFVKWVCYAVREMTRWYVWRDALTCVTPDDSFMCVSCSHVWLIHTCDSFSRVTYWHVSRDALTYVIEMTQSNVCLIHTCDSFSRMIYSHVWLQHMRDLFMCVSYSHEWLIHTCDSFSRVIYSHVWLQHMRDSFPCVTQLNAGIAHSLIEAGKVQSALHRHQQGMSK